MARNVTPEEAKDMIDQQGYVYVDVRSVGEFAAGHATGAYNVPLNLVGPAGPSPNEKFMAAMEKTFPRDARLVVACQAGGRSARAIAQLEAAGYTNLAHLDAGFEGRAQPGWRRTGLPVSQDSPQDRSWQGVEAKLGKP